jgi:transposase
MLEETHDRDQIIQRVAALDVGKAELACCVRVPGQGRSGRLQEVRTYQTMIRWLLVMADRLAELVRGLRPGHAGRAGGRRA